MIIYNFKCFIYWWLAELYALVPNCLWRVYLRRGIRLVGMLTRTEFILFATAGGNEKKLIRVSSDMLEPTIFSVASECIKVNGSAVVLRLGQELGLRKLLDLPLAAREDLDSVLKYEMDRISPFGSGGVSFAYRVAHVKQQERRILVEVEIVPRNVVDRVLAIAERLGLEPRRLELAGGIPGTALNLLPREASATSRMSRRDLALAGLALVVGGAAMTLPLYQQHATAVDLDRQAIIEKQAAEGSLLLRQRLDDVVSTMNFIFDQKNATVMTTRVLAELTRRIPDEAYVVQLHVDEREVRMHGYAQSVSDLIGSLARSPLFREAKFLSPITTDPRTGQERFQIAVGIRPAGG
jgi:general secretion pathway protein L